MRAVLVAFATVAVMPGGAAQALAEVPAVAVPASAELEARSNELSEVLNNEQTYRAMIGRMLHRDLPATLRNDPDFVEMEKRWPGIGDEMIAVMEPPLVDHALRGLPQIRLQMAAIYREKLTLDDMKAMLVFYRSPTGQRLLASVQDKFEIRGILDKQLASGGEVPIEAGEMGTVINSAGSQAIGAMSLEDRFELMKFAATPVGRKLPALNAQLQTFAAKLANEQDPEAEAQVEAAVLALVQRHLAADAAAASAAKAAKQGTRR